MKPVRIVYLLVLIVSLGLAFVLYYQYHLRDRELLRYKEFNQYTAQALEELNAKLAQDSKELEQALRKIEILSKRIASLEEDRLVYQDELFSLREERTMTQIKVARLLEAKIVLEKRLIAFENKLHSLKELKKALRIASKEEKRKKHFGRITVLKKLDQLDSRYGNKGFLVRDGETTSKTATKIRVELEPVNTRPSPEVDWEK